MFEKLDKLTKELFNKEEDYHKKKLYYSHKKNDAISCTDWDKINEKRAKKGYQKLSSDYKKNAYIEKKLYQEHVKYKQAEREYHHAKRLYENEILKLKLIQND